VTVGTSLLLIAAGAILRYAVTATASGIDLRVVGLVLMIVGIVGLVLSLLWIGVWSRSRAERPPEEVVREPPTRRY
jgi:heme/copper-type cytochrome/quinol oxidase subunit 2